MPTETTPATSASAISALLRRHGLSPLGSGTPRWREGIRVTGNVTGGVTVSVDLDGASAAKRVADYIEMTLDQAGYAVTRVANGRVRVTKPA